ncbi:MAG: hypothetical protein AAB067_06615, partial [Planctomycetota bacterium]
MAIKRFWKLYAVICVGLLCMPLLGATKVAGAVETLESSAVDHSFVAESGDWNTWSSVDQSSADILGEQSMLVAGNTAGSHAQAAASFTPSHSEHSKGEMNAVMEEFLELTKYGKAIHIMAMLMVGFGFLMVFVKRYGYGAVTATYIAVSVVIPYYMFLKTQGIFGEPA